MSSLELKGGILEMIAKINDHKTLAELKTLIAEFQGNHRADSDYWDELSESERQELDEAITESEDEANHIEHSEVEKRHRKWLGK